MMYIKNVPYQPDWKERNSALNNFGELWGLVHFVMLLPLWLCVLFHDGSQFICHAKARYRDTRTLLELLVSWQNAVHCRWGTQRYILSPTVKAPYPPAERGGSRDTQDCADQLHVPPANQDWGLWVLCTHQHLMSYFIFIHDSSDRHLNGKCFWPVFTNQLLVLETGD